MTNKFVELTVSEIVELLKSGWSVHRTPIRGDAMLYFDKDTTKYITPNKFVELDFQGLLEFVDTIKGWHPIFHGTVNMYKFNQDILNKVDYTDLPLQTVIDLLKNGWKIHSLFTSESALLAPPNNDEKYILVSESVMSELRQYGLNFIGFINYKSHPIFRGDDVYVYEIKQEGK